MSDFVAGNLLIYAAEHVIYGAYAYKIWDEESIKYVLNFLRPENMRIDVVSKPSMKLEGNISMPLATKKDASYLYCSHIVLVFSNCVFQCIKYRNCLIDGLFRFIPC